MVNLRVLFAHSVSVEHVSVLSVLHPALSPPPEIAEASTSVGIGIGWAPCVGTPLEATPPEDIDGVLWNDPVLVWTGTYSWLEIGCTPWNIIITWALSSSGRVWYFYVWWGQLCRGYNSFDDVDAAAAAAGRKWRRKSNFQMPDILSTHIYICTTYVGYDTCTHTSYARVDVLPPYAS